MDYALQLASVGYSGAFIHTRERGVSYNLFDPPPNGDESAGWTTGSTYYALLPVAEALSSSSKNGSYIKDMEIMDNSGKNFSAGYGVYDANTHLPTSLVVLNYADAGNQSASFNISLDGGKQTLLLRTLAAPKLSEMSNISWGGETFLNVKDAKMVSSNFAEDQQIVCDASCEFEVQSPGAAVLFIRSNTTTTSSTISSSAFRRFSITSVLGLSVAHGLLFLFGL